MSVRRRSFIASTAASLFIPSTLVAETRAAEGTAYDLIVVGAGTGGLPAAIFAARRGAKVLLLEADREIGGTLHTAGGEISGAGTKTQARFGVTDDHWQIHYDDVMRMSNGHADPTIVRLTAQNAASLIDWIDDHGWDCRPGHFLNGESPGRSGYSRRRYYQADGAGVAILNVFRNQIRKDIDAGNVDLMLNTRATGLLIADDGLVEGVRAEKDGESFAFRGKHTILTTGGYGMNPVLFSELVGFPTFLDDCHHKAFGDGLIMARDAGAHLRNAHLHRPGSGSVLNGNTFPTTTLVRFDTRPQRRAPWEIWVNDNGERYVNEETPERSQREQALLGQPRLRYTIVFDEEIFNRAPLPFPEDDWSKDKMAAHFNNHMMFHKADSLEELARRAEINPAGFEQTVAAYNERRNGADPLGRVHRPEPIAKPPYYAIVQHGHSVTSAVGITVNDKLQAVSESGEPIKGLYASGEVLGSGATLGNAFVPGMMLTPAMALSKLFGETLPLDA